MHKTTLSKLIENPEVYYIYDLRGAVFGIDNVGEYLIVVKDGLAIKDELEKRSLIKTSKYYKNLTSSNEKSIDQTDSLVAREYYQVELKEDMNDIAGNYLNLDAFNFTTMEKELLKLRLENRYSQVEIAKELAISQSKVSRMLKEMREKITITK